MAVLIMIMIMLMMNMMMFMMMIMMMRQSKQRETGGRASHLDSTHTQPALPSAQPRQIPCN